ncbi:MAG: M24 family metallopeptidase [Deltaproteobacteria bacterium]|nr:M24 family metallopeptidase [Deltaproteobacteria bacterium]
MGAGKESLPGGGAWELDTSEANSDLYYATRFLAPDPFAYVRSREGSFVIMSDLEYGRARAQARVDEVLSLSHYEEQLRCRGAAEPTLLDVLDEVLRERGVKRLLVPAAFPLEQADGLRERGYTVRSKKDPFFPERLVKSHEEVAYILETQRHTEAAFDAAVQALRAAEIRGDTLVLDGEVLTSEGMKRLITLKLMEQGCVAQHTIVACGSHGVDPHHEGAGPLRPHQSIIFDIFPRSSATRYFADMTRPVVTGRAPEPLKRLAGRG